jgi:hypothetical protein
MTSFIRSAKHVHDVESDLSYVEIVYDRYMKGKGYSTFTDYINTEPLADWIHLQSGKHSIPYERMAELVLENIMVYEQSSKVYVRIAHATKIIDPTFQPPRVNMESAWQMEFIKKLCKKYIPHAIQECTKKSRLEYFFNVLRIIELEQ